VLVILFPRDDLRGNIYRTSHECHHLVAGVRDEGAAIDVHRAGPEQLQVAMVTGTDSVGVSGAGVTPEKCSAEPIMLPERARQTDIASRYSR
jgi:hypothetical protein